MHGGSGTPSLFTLRKCRVNSLKKQWSRLFAFLSIRHSQSTISHRAVQNFANIHVLHVRKIIQDVPVISFQLPYCEGGRINRFRAEVKSIVGHSPNIDVSSIKEALMSRQKPKFTYRLSSLCQLQNLHNLGWEMRRLLFTESCHKHERRKTRCPT
jgi:hypothetical protein